MKHQYLSDGLLAGANGRWSLERTVQIVAAAAIFIGGLVGTHVWAGRTRRWVKPGPFPPEICSPGTLLKTCVSVLNPVNRCDLRHTQGVKAVITARERGGDQERLPPGVYGGLGLGHSEGTGRAFLPEGTIWANTQGKEKYKEHPRKWQMIWDRGSFSTRVRQRGKMRSLLTRRSHISPSVTRLLESQPCSVWDGPRALT